MADVIQNTKGKIYANYGQICRLRHEAAPVSLSLHVLGLCLSLRSLEGSELVGEATTCSFSFSSPTIDDTTPMVPRGAFWEFDSSV